MITPYEARVAELEREGMTTSDAQGVADVEFAQRYALTMLEALRAIASSHQTADTYTGADGWEKAHDKFVAFARAALAKAEGRV